MKNATATPWKVLDVNAIPENCFIQIAVFSTDSYNTPEAAEYSGGLTEVASTMQGYTQVRDCYEGIKAAENCMDGAHPLIIVYKEV